jgi:hypothetical protein
LSERVDEQSDDNGTLCADKVRQRKMMMSQASETFMIQVSPEGEGGAQPEGEEVREPADPKARARKGMIGRNPTIMVRMEADDDPEDLAQRVDQQIENESKPADPKARARKGMIGRNPTLMDVADMLESDDLVRMDAAEENAGEESRAFACRVWRRS